MKKLWQILCLCLFLNTPLFAVTVASLYQAELPVVSQADDLKEQAVKDGFLQVLIKVSGDPEIAKNPAIKPSLQKAAYYVQEYSYSLPTTTSSQYILQIRYEPKDVIRLLKKAKIAYWRETRPLILVWLLVTNNQQAGEIISNDAPEKIFKDIKSEGKKYGLPLIFPLMDMTDMSQVSAADIANMSIPLLKKAGKRYSPDIILIGKIDETEESTDSQWQLISNQHTWNFSVSDISTENVIANVMDQVRKTLENRRIQKIAGLSPQSTQWLSLEITNIGRRNDLQTLIRYFEKLALVKQVRLLQILGNNAQLSVLIQGTRDAFQQHTLSNQHLTLNLQDTNENKIVYEWMH